MLESKKSFLKLNSQLILLNLYLSKPQALTLDELRPLVERPLSQTTMSRLTNFDYDNRYRLVVVGAK